MRRLAVMWTIIVTGLVALSMDFWRWDDPIQLGPIGLPTWVMFFIGLQFALAVTVLVFALHDWDRFTPHNDDP